jgi:hypothetical protein
MQTKFLWKVLYLGSYYMPCGVKFHVVGLTAIFWALLKSRNNNCFEKKWLEFLLRSNNLLAYFSLYCAELQKNGDKEMLEAGADESRMRALHLHPYQAHPEDTRMVLLQWGLGCCRWLIGKDLLKLEVPFCRIWCPKTLWYIYKYIISIVCTFFNRCLYWFSCNQLEIYS